jgi:hypothetical protein
MVSERGSVQHSPRVDDEMADESTSPPEQNVARDAAEADSGPEIDIAAVDASAEHRAVLERSELARFLRPSSFPADRTTLLAVALEEGATDAVLAALGQLPAAGRWTTPAEVWESLGHETEHRPRPEPSPEPPPEPPAAPPPARIGVIDAALGVGVSVLQLGEALARGAVHALARVARRGG